MNKQKKGDKEMHCHPTPADIRSAIENALIDEMRDQPLAAVLAARRAVLEGLRNANREHDERKRHADAS